MEIVKLYDGKKPKSLDLFLKLVNISEDEFYNIVENHTVSPREKWNKDDEKINKSNFTPKDYNEWLKKFEIK